MKTENSQEVVEALKKAVDEMRALRDETRLKVHLASRDARAAWDRLEPAIEEAERDVAQASVTALRKIEENVKQLRGLVAKL